MRVLIGSTPTFEGSFFTGSGDPAVLDGPPVVTFFRDGEEVWANLERVVTEVEPGSGRWAAVVTTPSDSVPGWVQIQWLATVLDGADFITGTESFELVSHYRPIEPGEAMHILRRRLRDVLTDPADDSGAFFSDDEIHTFLAINGGNLNAAALDGWLIKAAHFSKFVDVDESGSSRRLSQMFKNAEAMVNFYRKATDADEATTATWRKQGIVGRVASLRGEYNDTFGLQFLARNGIAPSYVYSRPFPTKRLITGI